MGMLYEYEGLFNFSNKNIEENNMIIDFQYRVINGEKILYKYAPNNEKPSYKIDENGYVYLDIDKFSWQPVEVVE